jgi:hypothetical protein
VAAREENEMQKIYVNKIRCKKCGDIIESFSVHDFKFCQCRSVAVDGGHAYLRRLGDRNDWEDLSQYEEIDMHDKK